MRCNYIDIDAVRDYLKRNPHTTKDQAMEYARCKLNATDSHTRCKEHGAGDITSYFTRDMLEDEKERFIELYKNILLTYNVDEGNLYVCNMLCMVCREIVQSQKSDSSDMIKHIQNAISLGRDLAMNPREQKGVNLNIKSDALKDAAEISLLVEERMKLENR